MATKKKKTVSKRSPNHLIAIDDGRGRIFVFREVDQKSVLREIKETNCTDQEQLEDYNITPAHPANKYICIEYKATTLVS
jgi:hypothetical protein